MPRSGGAQHPSSIKLVHVTSTALEDQGFTPAAFFVAGVAGFLSRQKDKSSVEVVYDGLQLRLSVDASLSFRDLVGEVKNILAAPGRVFDSRTTERRSPDAFLDLLHSPERAQAAPQFTAQIEADTWSLTCENEKDDGLPIRSLPYLASFLDDAAQRSTEPISTIRLISEADALELYTELNNTTVPRSRNETVLDLVAQSVERHGSQGAVVFEGKTLSYADLEVQSTNFASILRAKGASQDRPVAACLPRTEMVPVLLLAILKAGSYFVPLDPSHPRQRLLDIVEECRPALVLVSEESRKLFAGSGIPLFDPVVDGDAQFEPKAESTAVWPSDKAYMIYTSGTTGRPKGVVIAHRSLHNLLLSMGERPGMTADHRVLAVATFSFDISVMDVFLPLCSGATLFIASEKAARDPWELARLLQAEDINYMQATPVTWRMLLTTGFSRSFDFKMISGGEALSRDLADSLLQVGSELWNCYGPTETTIYSSVLQVERGEGAVPIGPPIANTCFYIADAAGQLVPPGFAGELYIGGDGVAAGYYERPELQAERFVPDRWSHSLKDNPSQRLLFRTGDLVSLNEGPPQTISFFGRIDHQVKLRGYRIELGEIESVLRSYPTFNDAAVLLREDEPGEPWLVAYVTSDRIFRSQEVRNFAARRLPSYMLPSRIVALKKLPVTASGKVDRRALAALPPPGEEPGRSIVNSGSDERLDTVQTTLLRIFREVLRSKSFGPDDNFFAYGGYSLLAMRLFAKIGTVFHKQLPITALFDAPTVRGLAELIRSGSELQALVPVRTAGHRPPFFLVHSYLLYGLIGDVVEGDRPVYGLREQSAPESQAALERYVNDYVAAIESVAPAGTIHLGGWCAAATLTVELARQLMARGRKVGMVALFDAEAPGFVALPQAGSSKLARLRAMSVFHRERMHGMNWRAKISYLLERAMQAPLNLVEQFYNRNSQRIRKWQRLFPWLPGILFYNRFMQAGLLQTEHVEGLDIRIQLFRARDVTIIPGADVALGWGNVGRLGVDVTFIPGHHESMFLQPNVKTLRKEFRASIRSVEERIANDQLAEPTPQSLPAKLSLADN